MVFLWENKIKKKPKIIDENPSPTRRPIKRLSQFIPFFVELAAGMTVEAAVVLPLCLMFLMNLGSAVEMIRLHNNLQLALWDTGGSLALYGYEQGGSDLSSILSAFYVRNRLVDSVGEEYLDNSPLVYGSRGLLLLESEMLKAEDELDITVTYGVGPMSSLAGFWRFRMANRYCVHLWNGYAIPETPEVTELVYVTVNGEVCHRDRDCTYLRLSIRETSRWRIEEERNQWGRKYSACEKCAAGTMPETLYVTGEGDRYHYRSDCSGLKRTVISLMPEEAAGYRYCSRCGGG